MTFSMKPLLLLVAALMTVLPVRLFAEERVVVLTEEVQLQLADAFLAEGEYYRAVTEYKKFTILFPGSKKADHALYRMGMAYFHGDAFEPAARTFASVGAAYPSSAYAPASFYQEGVSYQRLGMPAKAAAAFARAEAAEPGSPYARLALLGKSLAEFDQDNIPACRRELERFVATYPMDEKSAKVRDAAALLERYQELPEKSPWLAGLMSALIPGSGHIYAGHYGDGVTAFFLNGLFIAGTVAALRQENYAVAGVVGVIGVPFYIGNIYGAANAGRKYTLGLKRDFRGRIALSLDYPF